MEIRDQGIDDVEGKARIDEDIGPAGTGLQGPRRTGAFKGPDTGRADGDDPPAFGLGLVDRRSRFFGNAVKFAVHFVVFNVFFFDRPEGPEADVQGDEDFFHALIADFLQQFFRK